MQPSWDSSSAPYKHSEITEQILAAFYTVYNALGYGFLEKVYRNALHIELYRIGMAANPDEEIRVLYAGRSVGEYYADLVVANRVIVEVKATRTLLPEHEAQLLNYLKATPYEVGLLLNFGPQPQQKRRAFENSRKEWWIAQNASTQSADDLK
jgi:GxxExxY protein